MSIKWNRVEDGPVPIQESLMVAFCGGIMEGIRELCVNLHPYRCQKFEDHCERSGENKHKTNYNCPDIHFKMWDNMRQSSILITKKNWGIDEDGDIDGRCEFKIYAWAHYGDIYKGIPDLCCYLDDEVV